MLFRGIVLSAALLVLVAGQECQEFNDDSDVCPGGYKTNLSPTAIETALSTLDLFLNQQVDVWRQIGDNPPCKDIATKYLCATLIPACDEELGDIEVLAPCQDDCEVMFELCIEKLSDYIPPGIYAVLPADCSDAEEELGGCQDLGLGEEHGELVEEAQRNSVVKVGGMIVLGVFGFAVVTALMSYVIYIQRPDMLPTRAQSAMARVDNKVRGSKRGAAPVDNQPTNLEDPSFPPPNPKRGPGGSKGSRGGGSNRRGPGGSKGSKGGSKGSRGGGSNRRGPGGSKGSKGGSKGSKGSRGGSPRRPNHGGGQGMQWP